MKIKNIDTLNNQNVKSSGSSKKMKLSDNATTTVFKMFTKSVYSNPIGSFIREVTSNCYDSHAEAKVNDPVVVKLHQENDDWYISFIDVGVGMSPDRVENVYSVYFESTKRNTNNEHGGFGIGGKTPMAYRRYNGNGENDYDNSFFVNTRYNGVEYHYVIYEGVESPVIDLLYKNNTSERNGTEVKIPLAENDLTKVNYEIKRQLFYFENIIFEGFNTDINNYKLYKGNTFIYRSGNTYSNIHVSLGKVAYPIDYSILGLDSYKYNIPVAINLNIGDVDVTVSRESLDYSEKSIKLLKKKLQEVADELKEMLVNQHKNVITLFDYYKVHNDLYKLYLVDNISLNLSNLNINLGLNSFENFKFKNVETIPSFTELLNLISERKFFGKTDRWGRNKKSYITKITQNEIKNDNIIHTNIEFKRVLKKQKYLVEEHTNFTLINFLNDFNNASDEFWGHFYKSYKINDIFNLKNTITKTIEDIISLDEFKDMVLEIYNYVISNTTNYNNVDIPQWFNDTNITIKEKH